MSSNYAPLTIEALEKTLSDNQNYARENQKLKKDLIAARRQCWKCDEHISQARTNERKIAGSRIEKLKTKFEKKKEDLRLIYANDLDKKDKEIERLEKVLQRRKKQIVILQKAVLKYEGNAPARRDAHSQKDRARSYKSTAVKQYFPLPNCKLRMITSDCLFI
ncbi:hypothetical protein B9Z55_007312 [Caenorhabditis nigoni]|uniref:Uncharacterized protein n=1 Tax=Caenorhabditis nigoni TaxID=1611254 RepID=A0A2G5V8Z3_9PELO|nr:hypothetical protein B9Z55_007312 [Caenorhabditis nigoni]